MKNNLLEISELSVAFSDEENVLSRVSFSLQEGETLALVGESGSGKSITALSILQLLSYIGATHTGGKVKYRGKEMTPETASHIRGKEIALIFQDPFSTFNPLQTIEKHFSHLFRYRTRVSKKNWQKKMISFLEMVHLPDPEMLLQKYPHECSGGMLQRIMIAMALVCRPKILIADEITTALDTTVQKKIIGVLQGLQKKKGFSMIVITHDLSLAANIADRIVVMDGGKVVEIAPVKDIFMRPLHSCTKKLISSLPKSAFQAQIVLE